jgi:chorismate synthase
LPAGEEIDMERVHGFLKRRAGGKNAWSTARSEPDIPLIQSGLFEGRTCGAPLCAVFENTDARKWA